MYLPFSYFVDLVYLFTLLSLIPFTSVPLFDSLHYPFFLIFFFFLSDVNPTSFFFFLEDLLYWNMTLDLLFLLSPYSPRSLYPRSESFVDAISEPLSFFSNDSSVYLS